jgi:hypothetical protein
MAHWHNVVPLLCETIVQSHVTSLHFKGQFYAKEHVAQMCACLAHENSSISHLASSDYELVKVVTFPGNKIKGVELLRLSEINSIVTLLAHENCIAEKVMGLSLLETQDVQLLANVLLRGCVQHLQVHSTTMTKGLVSGLTQALQSSRCCLRILDVDLQLHTRDAPALSLFFRAFMHENCQVVDFSFMCHSPLTEEQGKQLGRLLTSARSLPLTSLVFAGGTPASHGLCSCITTACSLQRLVLHECDFESMQSLLAWRDLCQFVFPLRDLVIHRAHYFKKDARLLRLMRSPTCRVEIDDFPEVMHHIPPWFDHTKQCVKVAALVFALRTASEVQRIGQQSAMRVFPIDMCRCVAAFLLPV